MHWRLTKLSFVFILGGVGFAVPAAAQATNKKLDLSQLSCGQKVLVDDRSCRAGEILQVTGSCLHTVPADGTRARGLQYNCIKRK